ncbi:hypothetical protein ES702_06097 [subsurface metagenome]
MRDGAGSVNIERARVCDISLTVVCETRWSGTLDEVRIMPAKLLAGRVAKD